MSTLTRPADHYGLTLILGGAEGNLWDISAMYASLAAIARAGPADTAPRFHELTVLAGRQGQGRATPPDRHRRGLAHARRLVRGAAPRRRRPLEKLRLEPRASPGRPAPASACATAGRWAAPRATRWACGWAMPAAKAGPASPAPTMAAPLMFGAVQSRCPRSDWFEIPVHALSASTPAPTTASSPTATATPSAPGCRATATSMRSRLTTCACTSSPHSNCA